MGLIGSNSTNGYGALSPNAAIILTIIVMQMLKHYSTH